MNYTRITSHATKTIRSWQTLGFISFAIALFGLLSSSYADANPDLLSPQVVFKQPEWAGSGAPGSRKGGGSRSGENQCHPVKSALTALVPGIDEVLDSTANTTPIVISSAVRGLTLSVSPTFWFYVPYQASGLLQSEFVLKNEQNQRVYTSSFRLAGTPGIIAIHLPPHAPHLEVGKDYQWSFSVVCNDQDRSADVNVKGFIQRVAANPDLKQRLATAKTLQQQVSLYANAGIWYEAITAIAQVQRKTPSSTASALMKDLLKSVGLEEMTQKPIVPCCTAQQ